MARVLKIACGLMGVLLFLFIGLFNTARNHHAPPEAVIMLFNGEYVGGYFITLVPDTDFMRFLTPSHNYRMLYPRRLTDEWIYFIVFAQIGSYGNIEGPLYRVRLDGDGGEERVRGDPSDVMRQSHAVNFLTALQQSAFQRSPNIREFWGWTHDYQWFLFTDTYDSRSRGLNHWRVWRFNPFTGERAVVSGLGNDFFAEWSPNRDWVLYYQVTDWDRTLWRMRPDGTNKERIWTRPKEFSYARNPDESFVTWYIVNRHWQPPILAAVALTLISTPLVLSHLRRQHPR